MTTSARTGMAKRIWLHLLSSGGYWSSKEIAEALGLTAKQIELSVYQMHASDQIIKRSTKDTRVRVRFGVTHSCKVPTGIALTEILAANAEVLEAA